MTGSGIRYVKYRSVKRNICIFEVKGMVRFAGFPLSLGSEAARRGDVPARYRRTCDKPTMEVRGGNGWRGSEKFTVSQL